MIPQLANECLALALDERGNLLSLVNRRTGVDYVTQPGMDLWQIIYPGAHDPETPVRASQQAPAEISASPKSVTVRHRALRDFLGHPVEAALTFTIEIEADELTFRATIENRGRVPLHEFWFPTIGGLGNLGDDPARTFLLYPESAGRRIQDPLRNLADREAQPVRGVRFNFLRHFYPGAASMQWMGLYGERGSLYVASHDRTLQTTALNAVLNVGPTAKDDSLSLGFIKYPFVQPGQTWRSEPFVVAVHDRPWHHDARRYRAFADTWQDHGRRATSRSA